MNDDEIFRAQAHERRELANVLETLSVEQWATASLCGAWTVRGVAGHLLMPLVEPIPKFLLTMLSTGLNFDKANVKLSNGVAERPTSEIVAGLRDHADRRFAPPGLGAISPLTDLVIHGQDIRRPLGLERTFPAGTIELVLDRVAGGSKGFVPKSRVQGLRFEATDIDWSAGPEPGSSVAGSSVASQLVTGTAEAMLLSIAGRTVALDDLAGDGVATLRTRLG